MGEGCFSTMRMQGQSPEGSKGQGTPPSQLRPQKGMEDVSSDEEILDVEIPGLFSEQSKAT